MKHPLGLTDPPMQDGPFGSQTGLHGKFSARFWETSKQQLRLWMALMFGPWLMLGPWLLRTAPSP